MPSSSSRIRLRRTTSLHSLKKDFNHFIFPTRPTLWISGNRHKIEHTQILTLMRSLHIG
ncbi:hypothetical protein D1BOALGB6SA_7064 [Olavius sp. associated proteobacterium Delta 1]|nr:hypothetical protein D1BOALGB6SA_7064 [Olavius sp. associated proteobacterium Delta 1]